MKRKPEWRYRLAAITHVNGTGGSQSAKTASNPLYHKLIPAFEHRTRGIVLNRSFNENEPVAETREQALACFSRGEMDALRLGRLSC